jgi:hypothetical protein
LRRRLLSSRIVGQEQILECGLGRAFDSLPILRGHQDRSVDTAFGDDLRAFPQAGFKHLAEPSPPCKEGVVSSGKTTIRPLQQNLGRSSGAPLEHWLDDPAKFDWDYNQYSDKALALGRASWQRERNTSQWRSQAAVSSPAESGTE